MSDQTKSITDVTANALPQDLEQRYKDYNNRLDQIISDLQELKRMLSSVDTDNPIHRLHQKLISQYPVQERQNYQAIDSNGDVFRYNSKPFMGTHNEVWYSDDDFWNIGNYELYGINWKDTLIKL